MNTTHSLDRPDGATTELSEMPAPDTYRMTSGVRQSFERLFTCWQDPECRLSEQEKTQLIDLEARFSVWGQTVGAFRRSYSSASLDSRVLTAARLKQHIADNLELLARALLDIEQLGLGIRTNRQVAVRELADDERILKEFEAELAATSTSFRHLMTTVEHTTMTFACSELADELTLANQVVASLLRTAVYITDNAPRERYFRSQNAAVFDLSRDVGHLKDKFPYLEKTKPWLLERVARANVSTRHYLTYREDHHNRIAQSDEEDDNRASQSPYRDDRSQPSTEATKVLRDIDPEALEKVDGQSESASSITSSVVKSPGARFPALPEDLGSGKRLCPLCQTMINLGSSKPRERWQKHVLHDLEPYVCTFDNCTGRSFGSRRQWFEHEIKEHRQIWSCQVCKNLTTRQPKEFETHLRKCLARHRGGFTTDTSDTSLVMAACQSPMRVVNPAECSFCGYDWLQPQPGALHSDTSVSLQTYRAHVGGHLLDEALFSLRQMHLEWEDEDEDDDDKNKSEGSPFSAASLADNNVDEVRTYDDPLTQLALIDDVREPIVMGLEKFDGRPAGEVTDNVASYEDDPADLSSFAREHGSVSDNRFIREDGAVSTDSVDGFQTLPTESEDLKQFRTAHDDTEERYKSGTAGNRGFSYQVPSDYEVKDSKFFQVGKLFRYLHVEPMGYTHVATAADDDESVYKTLRAMIVVKRLQAHAICVPIFSYGNQGLGRQPQILPGERRWASMGIIKVEDAFTVHPSSPGLSLSPASRIRFDTPYTVQYNLRVKEVGIVLRSQRSRLEQRWKEANS